MKILTVNWTYKYGSTGKIILDIEHELPEYDFCHCAEYQTLDVAGNVYVLTDWLMCRLYNRTSRLKGLQYQNGIRPTNKLLRRIAAYKPDIVHIHCPNGHTLNLYKVLDYLKKNQIPTVITNHAEFFFTGNCPHAFECRQYMDGCKHCPDFKTAANSLFLNRTAEAWTKMYQSFRNFQKLRMVCVSDWQAGRLQGSAICKDLPCSVIYNGVDTEIFRQGAYDGMRTKRAVLFVTASFTDAEDDPKGGRFIIRLAEQLKETNPEIEFWVVGPDRAARANKPSNLKIFGEITDQRKLAEIYSDADVTIITSRRETFGMACAESMCCGTPVIGFVNGGTESIALKEYSAFVPYGNLEALKELTLLWADRKHEIDREKLSGEAQAKYSRLTMARQYDRVYRELLGEE